MHCLSCSAMIIAVEMQPHAVGMSLKWLLGGGRGSHSVAGVGGGGGGKVQRSSPPSRGFVHGHTFLHSWIEWADDIGCGSAA